MSPLPFPAFALAQVVRMKVSRDVDGLLVAKSADLPGQICTAHSESALADRIAETIRRWFAEQGKQVMLSRSDINDLRTWYVEEHHRVGYPSNT